MANINGTSGNDTLNGTSGDDTIAANDGNDVIYAGTGDDTVYGGDGNDSIFAGDVGDELYGGAGDDFLAFGGDVTALYGGTGADEFYIDNAMNDGTFDIAFIMDFEPADDVIRINVPGFASYSDVQAIMNEVSGVTIMNFGNGLQIVVDGVVPAQLSAVNFAFGAPVCFTPGTLIRTPEGDRLVEDLKVGDHVLRRDAGPCPIRWILHRRVAFRPDSHMQKPIEIKAGALQDGLPRRRLVVSPQHRMLMKGPQVERLFGSKEVLAVAKGLTGLSRVRQMQGKHAETYISILLDQHHILIAEDAQTESFFPGPTALRMLPESYRTEIQTLFPKLRSDPKNGYGPTARPVLTVAQTRLLVRAIRDEKGSAVWNADAAAVYADRCVADGRLAMVS